MRFFLFIIAILVLNSCKSDNKQVEQVKSPTERGELSQDSKIFYGNRLFSEKTCITCHAIEKYKKAPSVMEIIRVYKENDASIEMFLRGNSKPIVETNDSLIAVMQANIDGFLQQVTDEELNAITTYMLHVTELKTR